MKANIAKYLMKANESLGNEESQAAHYSLPGEAVINQMRSWYGY